jgi:hypothetical protein
MLVMMALLTTVMTTPILLRLTRGTELEEYISKTSFARRVQCDDDLPEHNELTVGPAK